MSRRVWIGISALAIVAAGAGWVITAPKTVDAASYAGLTGDVARGELAFSAAGCASCHVAEGASGDAKLILSGGQKFPSDFGTFVAPNISPDPEHGIGGWTVEMLANAVTKGTSPEGRHYYPAFPWNSYALMEPQDLVDIHAYMQTLPASQTPSQPHQIGFPFNIDRGIGLWKLAFAKTGYVIPDEGLTEEEKRGRYLVEVMGHCGECHTPRNVAGAFKTEAWLAGTATPEKRGFPDLTPRKLDWSNADIVEYLTSGFTPDYDSVGGHMAMVVDNYAKLPESERQAVAAYLKKVPNPQ